MTKCWVVYGESVRGDTFLTVGGDLRCDMAGVKPTFSWEHSGAVIPFNSCFHKPSLMACEVLEEGRSLI